MTNKLKEICQISIHIKDEIEKLNEVALFHPLSKKSAFDKESKPLSQRKWNYLKNLGILQRFTLSIQKMVFKHLPFLIPMERQTKDAKFKTILAILLSQETLRDFFLNNAKQRETFFKALKRAAQSIGHTFVYPDGNTPLQISRNLTWIEGKESSLIDDLVEFNLQISAIDYFERNDLLFKILNEVERPPIHSVLEISSGEVTDQVFLVTKYAKYKIEEALKEGKFTYSHAANTATSSIRTLENTRPHAIGAMNQRMVLDAQDKTAIGAYSGELTSPQHVLEQILFILNEQGGVGWILKDAEGTADEKKILFTSLYSWHEFGLLKEQAEAIQYLNQKVLKTQDSQTKLRLLHFNIPFNALNKYPMPQELAASIQDLNEESLIFLSSEFFKKINIAAPELFWMAERLDAARELPFLKKSEQRIAEIDRFKELKNTLLTQLEVRNEPAAKSLMALLTDKKPDGKASKGIDKLIYLDVLAQYLGYFHSKNCKKSTDRSAGADAADKAQYAFQKYLGYPFLPAYANEEETSLFKVCYSMYLVWEEPEITTALSTGFLGEKFYSNLFQRNPETTKYLIDWLKKHPEMYLGLSEFRS